MNNKFNIGDETYHIASNIIFCDNVVEIKEIITNHYKSDNELIKTIKYQYVLNKFNITKEESELFKTKEECINNIEFRDLRN